MINEKLIAPPVVRFSWTNVLAEMGVEEDLEVSIEYDRTISQRISREIKLKYPDRTYRTDRKSKPGKLVIRRTK
ncbi:MAG: hypothetical protein Q8R83_05925 [Legionellaceae bacterium]|nr:hypothetical protein [Legionellaceae bacterium]